MNQIKKLLFACTALIALNSQCVQNLITLSVEQGNEPETIALSLLAAKANLQQVGRSNEPFAVQISFNTTDYPVPTNLNRTLFLNNVFKILADSNWKNARSDAYLKRQLPILPQIIKLDLANDRLGDYAKEALDLSTLTGLQEIHLENNNLAIQPILPPQQLRVYLENNPRLRLG